MATAAILSNETIRARISSGLDALRERFNAMRSSGYDELDIDRDDAVAFDAAQTAPIAEVTPYSEGSAIDTRPTIRRASARTATRTASPPSRKAPPAADDRPLRPAGAGAVRHTRVMQQTGIAHPYLDAARKILPEVIALRRRLHRVPEVGLELPRTQALVLDAVRGLGLEPVAGVTVGSVVATIEGAGPGPTILLRADMDGLPLTEETGLDFASEHDGRMHACGHDTHVAMLMGAARLLLEDRASWSGRVLLMFQPGEEGFHGARYMLEEGLLDQSGGERPSGAFALHISTLYETGTIDVRPGPMLASGDTLRITVRGRGGHASTPYTAVDPITVAAEIVLALQLMVTRRVDVFDPAVVTIAQVVAGTTTNIIPETAFLAGTMRTVSAARREAVKAEVRRVCEGIAAAHGASVELEIEPGYPVTVNDDGFTALVLGRGQGGGRRGDDPAAAGPDHGCRGLLVCAPAGAGGDGIRRCSASRSRCRDRPDEPLEPGRSSMSRRWPPGSPPTWVSRVGSCPAADRC